MKSASSRREAYGDAYCKCEGEPDHKPCDEPFDEDADEAKHDERGDREEHLAQVDFIPEYRVEEAHFEQVAEKVMGEQRHRRCVGPEYRHVGHRDEPCGQKPVIVAERLLRISVYAARIRVAVHEVVVVAGDDEHDGHRDEHADAAACGAGLEQVVVARYDKRAPPDARPDGKSPCGRRG